jgi:phosphatidylinositol alpha-mannosyltransferase
MRVVQVTQSFHPRPGGVTEHVDHVSRELRRRGHDVSVVTADFARDGAGEPEIIRLGRNVLVPINGAWVNMTVGWNLQGKLRRILDSLQPDVIHTHCPLAPTLPLMTLGVAPPGSLVVGTFHAAARQNLGYRIFGGLLEKSAARLDVRIAVSDAARSLAASYFPGDYTIVPNGVDCERFSPSQLPFPDLVDDAFNILFVGRMDKRKGLKYLFRAVSIASKRTPRRLRLIVVGDNGPRRHLLPKVDDSVDVVFRGIVDRDLVPRYYATGHMFCSPAIGRESFGIVLLEAMASGLPVVGTAIRGYLSVLKPEVNALVVPPKDPTALADAIVRLAGDEPLRWRLRRAGISFAQSYRWERIVDRLEAVYRGQTETEPSWRSSGGQLVTGSLPARAQKA